MEKLKFSEVPVLFGESPISIYQLWKNKTEGVSNLNDNFIYKLEFYLKEGFLNMFCNKNKLDKYHFLPNMFYENEFMCGHVDFIYSENNEVYEFKFLSTLKYINGYRLEMNAILGTGNLKKGYIVYLLNNYKMDVVEVEFDKELYDLQLKKTKEFLELVETKTPPILVEENIENKDKIDHELMISLINKYQELSFQIKELEENLEQTKTKIKEMMKIYDIKQYSTANVVALLTSGSRTDYDWKEISKVFNLEPYKKTKIYEIFSIKPKNK